MFNNKMFNELIDLVGERDDHNIIELNVNNDVFSLKFKYNKYITINKYGFLFEVKDDKNRINNSVVRVTPSNMNFYNKTFLENGVNYCSFGVKFDSDYKYMKISENIYSDNLYKTDIETDMKDNKPITKTVNRIYNKDGLLIKSFEDEEELFLDTEDYIKSQVFNSLDVYNLCTMVEETLPGITDYIVQINDKYSDIVSTYNKVLKK